MTAGAGPRRGRATPGPGDRAEDVLGGRHGLPGAAAGGALAGDDAELAARGFGGFHDHGDLPGKAGG
jgi:hypothetical protein